MIAYHGTNTEFEEFRKPELNRMAMRAEVGFWFTSSISDANFYGDITIEAELTINKPRRITRKALDELAVSFPLVEVIKQLKAGGHDGLVVEAIKPDRVLDEPGMPEQYVVFEASQIRILSREIKKSRTLQPI